MCLVAHPETVGSNPTPGLTMATEPQFQLTASECVNELSRALHRKALKQCVAVPHLCVGAVTFRQYSMTRMHASMTVALEGVDVLISPHGLASMQRSTTWQSGQVRLSLRHVPFYQAYDRVLSRTYTGVSAFVLDVSTGIREMCKEKFEAERTMNQKRLDVKAQRDAFLANLPTAPDPKFMLVVDSFGEFNGVR